MPFHDFDLEPTNVMLFLNFMPTGWSAPVMISSMWKCGNSYFWWNNDINSVNNQRNKNSGTTQWLVLQKTSLPKCRSSIIPDEEDIECPYGVIAPLEITVPCFPIKVTISDSQKLRLNLQVKLEQLDAYYGNDELSKTQRAWEMLKTKINVTYDKESMTVTAMEKIQWIILDWGQT